MALTIDAYHVMKRGFVMLQDYISLIHTQVAYDKDFSSNWTQGGISCDADKPMPWQFGATVSEYFKKV